jgi:hypothetical protein
MPEAGGPVSREDVPREEGRREEQRRPTLIDRLDDAWAERPRWEDRPNREERPSTPPRAPRRRDRDRDRSAYEPIAVLPERILSYALRAVVLLLVVVALISVLEPA